MPDIKKVLLVCLFYFVLFVIVIVSVGWGLVRVGVWVSVVGCWC